MSLVEREEIERFAEKISEEVGESLEEIILFGSYATDDYVPGSDVDLAVVVEDKSSVDEKKLWSLAEEFQSRYGAVFSPKVFEKEEFDYKVKCGYSFYSEISEEGVKL
ncbi:MAG: nucleotidyltransferase domain-containing protein [Candidatus Nanohaloarchaea archaeon]